MGDVGGSSVFPDYMCGVDCYGTRIQFFVKFLLNYDGDLCGKWHAWWNAWIKKL